MKLRGQEISSVWHRIHCVHIPRRLELHVDSSPSKEKAYLLFLVSLYPNRVESNTSRLLTQFGPEEIQSVTIDYILTGARQLSNRTAA